MTLDNYNKKLIGLDMLKELYRRDFALFAAEQLWITGVQPGSIFPMRKFTRGQEIIHRLVEDQRKKHGWIRIVIIKGRQLGASTYFAGRAFHLASLNRGVSTLLLAHDEDTAKKIFEKCKTFFNHMNEDLRPLTRRDNRKELVFENPDPRTRGQFPGLESTMQFQHAKNILAGTGTTQHFCHISEAAKYNSQVCALLESSLLPSIHLVPGTAIVNESTAFIGGDYFRSCCERAVSGLSEWVPCFIPWFLEREEYALPLEKGEKIILTPREREIQRIAKRGNKQWNVPPWEVTPEQFKWRRVIIAEREDGENIFLQEYPSCPEEAWITMDLNVFSRDRMNELRAGLKNPEYFATILPGGRFVHDNQQKLSPEDNYLAIWKDPETGHQYDIGVDTSVGVEGGDWSVAEVFDRQTGEQVAEMHVLMDGFELAEKLYWLGYRYNMAQIAIEMASSGYAVNGGLQRLGYPYLYIWRHRERSFPTLSSYTGWKTSRESKSYMITVFKERVNKGPFTIHSHVLWNEMYYYIREPGSDPSYDIYRGGNGMHDDSVMATGICIVACDDETMGALKPMPNREVKTIDEIVSETLRTSGPAFVDITDPGTDKSYIQSMSKELLEGWA